MVLHDFNIMRVECRDIFMQKNEHKLMWLANLAGTSAKVNYPV